MSDLDTFARTLYGEARGTGLAGIEAVANVIINRMDHPCWWGDDVESVCRTPFQFSCWNPHDPNLPIIQAVTDSNAEFYQCLEIAQQAIDGQLVDNTGGATYYYAASIPAPKWAVGKTPSAMIGGQLFFNNIN